MTCPLEVPVFIPDSPGCLLRAACLTSGCVQLDQTHCSKEMHLTSFFLPIFFFSHFHWFLCGSSWSAGYLVSLVLAIHCCLCLCHRKWGVQIILLLLDGKVFVVKLEWFHRNLSSWVRNVTKWKQCQLCSPSSSLVLLFWSSSVIWKRAQHGLTTSHVVPL